MCRNTGHDRERDKIIKFYIFSNMAEISGGKNNCMGLSAVLKLRGKLALKLQDNIY